MPLPLLVYSGSQVPTPFSRRPLVNQRRGGDILKRQAKIACKGAFCRPLSARFASGHQFAQVSMDRRKVLEVSDLAIVLKLGHIIRAELVSLAERVGMPVGIEIHQRRECSLGRASPA